MNISSATIEDAAAIFDLQRLAYQTEAAIYDDFSIPPLVETLDQLRDQFCSRGFLKAMEGGRLVGSVRAFQKDATCYVERLIVDPEHRNRGIGAALLRRIEAAYPAAARFQLFTGHKSINNLRLYERLGYRPFRRQPVNEKLTMVYLEKVVAPLV
jgi:ribosomal protein S18 acetylase RimI-like enzyme